MQTMERFERPEWLGMLERFCGAEYEQIITYNELDKCIMNGSVKTNKRYVFDKFKRELLHQYSKTLENIKNIGYRVVRPNEHVRLTTKRLRQAEKRARQGADVILHVNYEALTDKERAQANIIASRIQNVVAGLIGENKSIKQLTVHYKQPEVPRK